MPRHDLYLDVLVEVPVFELQRQADPTKYLYELMRHKANEMCVENGAELRTDRPPQEVIIKEARSVLGVDMTLVASRWAVTGSDRLLQASR